MTQAPRGKSPETSFMQPSEMGAGTLQPRLLGRLPISSGVLRQVPLSLGLQTWSRDPGPLDMASPEPVSRPHCLLACFPMSSVFGQRWRGGMCWSCPLSS